MALRAASNLAAPATVTVPPLIVPPFRVNDPVGFGPASVRARVAPVLVKVAAMFTVPAVWLTVPSWAVVNGDVRFRMPPETTSVPALFKPALTLTVPPVGAITWPPARLFRGIPKVTVLPLSVGLDGAAVLERPVALESGDVQRAGGRPGGEADRPLVEQDRAGGGGQPVHAQGRGDAGRPDRDRTAGGQSDRVAAVGEDAGVTAAASGPPRSTSPPG